MRIVGGRYKGRRITPPKGIDARPTTDYAKEGLFNILQHSVALDGIRVLDLFAGTGNISAEFVSRGAEQVTSVEMDRKLIAGIQRLVGTFQEPGWNVVNADAFQFLRMHRASYDIIFADPPFHMEGIERIPTLVLAQGLLEPDGLLIVEHSEKVDLQAIAGFTESRAYGAVHFSFFGSPRT